MNIKVCIVFLLLGCASVLFATEQILDIQTALQERGYYRGPLNGEFTGETSAALTRYQVRNGLEITGRPNREVLEALGRPASLDESQPPPPSQQAWTILREEDQEFIESLPQEEVPDQAMPDGTPVSEMPRDPQEEIPANAPAGSVPAPDLSPVQEPSSTPLSTPLPPEPEVPSPQPEAPSPEPEDATPVPEPAPPEPEPEVLEPRRKSQEFATRERLRDYIAAFVLAGLEPTVDEELSFFADRVNYFDRGVVSRETIRRDLQAYNERYPQRSFRLAGGLQVERLGEGDLVVTFPLRYAVSNDQEQKSGKVLKTLKLKRQGRQLEIVAVDEEPLN